MAHQIRHLHKVNEQVLPFWGEIFSLAGLLRAKSIGSMAEFHFCGYRSLDAVHRG